MKSKNVIIILIALVLVIGIIFVLGQGKDVDPVSDQDLNNNDQDQSIIIDQPEDVAENWIKEESLTYVYDGLNLELVSKDSYLVEGSYILIFSFDSRAAGYGDRTDQMSAQVITPHEMTVLVEDGEVTMAITDGVFDEMRGVMIE
jgi:hypothetical protein